VNTPSPTDERSPARPIHVLEAPAELQIHLPAAQPAWRTAFDRRRALVAAVLAPVAGLLFFDAPLAGSIDHPAEWAVLGLLGVLSAALWATFVPRRDRTRTAAASPCGAMAAVYPIIALMTLGGQPLSALLAVFTLLMVGYGVGQRVFGTGACST